MTINWAKIREDFPVLNRQINNQPLIYLDNAATTQKPKNVIEALKSFYEMENANVYRSVHTLSGEATQTYDAVREKTATFINAQHKEEIIFTHGTTSGINQLARSLADEIEAGDEILLTYMEHHSNLIPWQQLAKAKNAKLVYVRLTAEGEIDLNDYQEKLSERTKIVTFTHVSNVLGTINPVQKMTRMAHEKQALVIVDGAQAVSHFKIDVQDLDVDFYVFSGHKMYGPTGVGVWYGKRKWLEQLEPATFGGEMIQLVEEEASTWADIPHKFEAGTPNIAGVIGLGAAMEYLTQIGMANISAYENELTTYAYEQLSRIPAIEIYGPKERASVLSFNLGDIHPHDVATALDLEGIEIRAGHHCAQLLMKQLQVPATSRISLAFYNTKEEIDRTIAVLNETKEFFEA